MVSVFLTLGQVKGSEIYNAVLSLNLPWEFPGLISLMMGFQLA